MSDSRSSFTHSRENNVDKSKGTRSSNAVVTEFGSVTTDHQNPLNNKYEPEGNNRL